MKKILYIGNQSSLLPNLQQHADVDLLQVDNVVGFHNSLYLLPDMDLVISENKMKGMGGSQIFDKYAETLNAQKLPFAIVSHNLETNTRLNWLNAGISELYRHEIDADSVANRVVFLREMLEAKLSTTKKVVMKDYQIPVSKRVFDIAVAGFALLMASPVMILTAIAIKIESKGPIWYVSKRVGTGYKVFDFYKLRSMYMDADTRVKDMKHLNQYSIDAEKEEEEEEEEEVTAAETKSKSSPSDQSPTLIYKDGKPMSEEEYLEYKKKQSAGTFVKFKDDPRVTKVGKFIRNTSIDELPQLINVLKGDMSIVGNRPLPLYEAEQLTSDDWGERFLAPAGITGLWQVMKRGKGDMSEEERKGLDNQYARKVSLWNDIRLVLKTIPALFQKENV